MSTNKRRGDKYYGRGHRKNGSGRRGGTGRAGKHKRLAPVVYKKRSPYIHASKLVEQLSRHLASGAIIEMDGIYHVWTNKLPKILEKRSLPATYELH